MKRMAGVRGQFYPNNCAKITQMIDTWNAILEEKLRDKSLLKVAPRAIIAPHAGYVYSGFTANFAHRLLGNSHAKRVLVFGPSHRVYIQGLSASEQESYESPCGELEIDALYLRKLKKNFPIEFVASAHHVEHSTETQMPFIKHYLPNAKIIEFIYGNVDTSKMAKLMSVLLKDPENVIVISTDLSHFYTLENANKLDNICLNALLKKDPTLLNKGCEACGMLGVKAIMSVAIENKMSIDLLDYRTSADASGDSDRVVGYVSAYVK